MRNLKRIIYIFTFALLGILLQFIVHGLLEIWYIGLLLTDFPRYGFGLSWDAWVFIHNVGTGILFVAGLGVGFWQGKYWWRRIYEQNISSA